MKGSSFLPILIFLMVGCSLVTPEEQGYDNLSCVRYEESSKIIANPERGFYTARDFTSTGYTLSKDEVESSRLQNKTLFYTGYYLTDFMNSDISDAYLDMMRKNFRALREGGAKCVLRFAYMPMY